MGFFSKYNKIEKELLELYSKIFSEMGLPDARKMTEDILDQVIESSKKEGRYDLKNVGDVLLEKEADSGKVNQNFEDKRKEGVRDEDIRWWLNLNDIERMMMLKVDEFSCLSLFIKEREGGKTKDEADIVVRKYHPIFGDLNDKTHGDGDNRPLPLELKNRINIYIEKKFKDDPEKYKKEIEQSSSFNALVRKEIKAGNL